VKSGEMLVKKSVGLAVANSKIFLVTDCRFTLSPKGVVLLPILCVRFSRISKAKVLQKSALIMNTITTSKIKTIHWGSNNYILFSITQIFIFELYISQSVPFAYISGFKSMRVCVNRYILQEKTKQNSNFNF